MNTSVNRLEAAINLQCERIQTIVDDFATEPETFRNEDPLREVAEHIQNCGPCRSRIEHDLEGARPEVLSALRRRVR